MKLGQGVCLSPIERENLEVGSGDGDPCRMLRVKTGEVQFSCQIYYKTVWFESNRPKSPKVDSLE